MPPSCPCAGAKGGAEHLARKLQLVEKRRENVRYSLEHWADHFLILTNHFKGEWVSTAPLLAQTRIPSPQARARPRPPHDESGEECLNSMLVRAPLASPGAQHWTAVFQYDAGIQLKGLTCFSQHVVLHGRQGGFSQLWVYTPSPARLAKGEAEQEAARRLITHPEPVYCAFGGSNHNYEVRHATCLSSRLRVVGTRGVGGWLGRTVQLSDCMHRAGTFFFFKITECLCST